MSEPTPAVPTPESGQQNTPEATPVTPPTIDAQVVGYTPAPEDPRQRYEDARAQASHGESSPSSSYSGGTSGAYSSPTSGPYAQSSGSYAQSSGAYTQGTNPQGSYTQSGPYATSGAQGASGTWGSYTSPAGQPGPAPYQSMTAPKSKIVAGVLGIVLGCFGIHNFYLGYIGKGLAQLALTVLTFGILSFISVTWGLIEGILILVSQPGSPWHRDAQGQELTD